MLTLVKNFDVLDHRGRRWTKEELLGRWTVLWWFPKASGSVCTVQARGFASRAPEFEHLGVQVLGASFDSPKANNAFALCERIAFPLLCDANQELGGQMGVVRAPGSDYEGRAHRMTFLINPKAEIFESWSVADADVDAARALARFGVILAAEEAARST